MVARPRLLGLFALLERISSARILLIAALVAAAPAYAQSDPGTIERTIPRIESKDPDKATTITAPTSPPQTGAKIEQTFILSAVTIDGATVFTSEELAPIFEPYLASRVGQQEVNKIASDITQRYREAGFLLSYAVVPEQSVQSGIVRIRVVEGFVGNVRLAGKKRPAMAVHGIFEKLTSERPLRRETLERAIALGRDVPGVIVSDVRISRSLQDPARHQLTITVGASRYGALAYTDNRGTIENARMRGYTSFNIASLAVPGDRLQVDLFTIPYGRFRYGYGQAKASIPLNSDGLRMSASASYGDQLQRLSGPNQHGTSRQLTGDISYPFVKGRAFSLVGSFQLTDWKSEQERAGTIFQRDRIQVARAWVELVHVTNIRVAGKLGVSRGFDWGSATEKGDSLASRPGASSKFTKFNAAFDLVAPLYDRVRLRFDASAQYSPNSLLAPEEYALGGSRIGRAFDFNELTGDRGFGGMMELALPLGDLKRGPKAMEIFGFVDGGGAFRKHASPGLPKEQWLASAGLGTRFTGLGLLWSGEVGVPITNSGANRGVRAFFSLTRPF